MEDAWPLLRTYPWPGNIQELENCLKRALTFGRGHTIREEDIRRALQFGSRKRHPGGPHGQERRPPDGPGRGLPVCARWSPCACAFRGGDGAHAADGSPAARARESNPRGRASRHPAPHPAREAPEVPDQSRVHDHRRSEAPAGSFMTRRATRGDATVGAGQPRKWVAPPGQPDHDESKPTPSHFISDRPAAA